MGDSRQQSDRRRFGEKSPLWIWALLFITSSQEVSCFNNPSVGNDLSSSGYKLIRSNKESNRRRRRIGSDTLNFPEYYRFSRTTGTAVTDNRFMLFATLEDVSEKQSSSDSHANEINKPVSHLSNEANDGDNKHQESLSLVKNGKIMIRNEKLENGKISYFSQGIPVPHFYEDGYKNGKPVVIKSPPTNGNTNGDHHFNFAEKLNLEAFNNRLKDDNTSSASKAQPPVKQESIDNIILAEKLLPGEKDENAQLKKSPVTLRSLWRHRNAKSAEEGIRREKTSTKLSLEKTRQLSSVLDKASDDMMEVSERKFNKYGSSRKLASRTISGLISALAEEVDDLEVQVNADPKSPLWKKQVDDVTIQFSRLGFKPLRMGGGALERGQKRHHFQARSLLGIYDDFVAERKKKAAASEESSGFSVSTTVDKDAITDKMPTADEAFDRIDVDNSGALDRDELIQALNLAANASFQDLDEDNRHIIETLASDLVELYDFNGDGVVDRKEYKSMVADMAALREKQLERQKKREEKKMAEEERNKKANKNDADSDNTIFAAVRKRLGFNATKTEESLMVVDESNKKVGATMQTSITKDKDGNEVVEVLDSPEVIDAMAKTLGSITFSDVKLDLRRLLFGAVPVLKHITPGGPLILEPFTVTVNGSFNREDIMNSFLLDAGLRRLVARVLRVRVGALRDIFEGAVWKGRSWTMFGETAPKCEVAELSNIEFDNNNKLIITGRARIRSTPNAPVVEQAFKVRTRIGTRQNGRFVRLEEPELALVVECPRSWEKNIGMVCDALNVKKPSRPKPLYSFFPIYSPFKLNDDGGFDLGEDNVINALYINDGRLCVEMSSVLRPGRFLGSHYIAFSIPNRTFIVTLDRVKNGIRAARKTKKAARELLQSTDNRFTRRQRRRSRLAAERNQQTSSGRKKPRARPGFFGKFVDGYLQAEREQAKKERITTAIRDFFGRQEGKRDDTRER